MKNITIVGSGSWGVALAIYLAGQGIKIWSFSEEEKDLINNERKCKFLPNAVIPGGVYCTNDMKEAIDGAEFILHVTPSKFTRNIVKQYKPFIKENQGVVVCSKGFEAETMKTLDEVVAEELPNNKIGVLSGPSHAEEVSVLIPTALVVASENDELIKNVVEAFSSDKMRLYTSKDVKGAELGGALKNIIAFCAGVCAGLELGDNTFAALLTRGLLEISRLGVALGGNKDTFYGLTGLGDLIVTCSSMHSRNRRAGMLIGKGYSIEEARKEVGMVIESIDNIEVAYKLSKLHKIEVPIIDTVYDVLYNNLNPREAVNMLMTRDLKEE
jgi:glycerol-3-phosphate dehydrogenase (NAD(P)+)